MMKPLLLASLLALSSFALAGCADDDDPVIREQSQQSTGTPKQPFSADLSDNTSDVPVDPAEGRDLPGGPDLSAAQSQPQFRE